MLELIVHISVCSESFRRRDTQKIYIAKSACIAKSFDTGTCKNVVHWLRKNRKRNRVAVVPPGSTKAQQAESTIEVLSCKTQGPKSQRGCVMKLTPMTGRPHQLRVACASLGLPILGDIKYGCKQSLSGGRAIALHALELQIPHPTRREEKLCLRTPELPFWVEETKL